MTRIYRTMSAGSESPVVGPGAAGGDSGKGKDTEGSTSVPQTADAGLWEVFWSRISVRGLCSKAQE